MSATDESVPPVPATPAGCGAHTATAMPDAARDNLHLYVGGSSGACQGIDIVRIKISDPTNAVFVRRAPAGRQCHDNNVILGTVNLAMCAGGNGFSMLKFDPALDPAAEGGIENPTLLYSRSMGISTGHSGSFSYDGKVLIFGHEPGGGTQAQCEAGDSILNKSLFFIEPLTGNTLGTMVHVRPQGNQENCTWHNFNVVPTYKGNVAVIGNYQIGHVRHRLHRSGGPAGDRVRRPGAAHPRRRRSITGGDWSTYWHNGKLYESDIRRGLIDLGHQRAGRESLQVAHR